MAISASTVWEVRTTGSDSSGGGFVAGAAGTDRSQSDTAFVSGTNLTVDATTNTDVTPDGHTPTSADVGNLIQITTTGGGSAFTVGFYQIASIQSGKWRLDRSPGATSSAGATWAMGGALASVSKLSGAMVASNKAWIKSGTYTNSSVITFGQTGVAPSGSIPATHLVGYHSTRGDTYPGTNAGNRPQILVTTLNANVVSCSNFGFWIENLIFGPSGVATCGTAISVVSGYAKIINCKVSNFSVNGISTGGGSGSLVAYCEATGGTGGVGITVNGASVKYCYVHDMTGAGGISIAAAASGVVAAFNLVANCAGSSSDGIAVMGNNCAVNNTIHGAGRDGIRWTLSGAGIIKNNIISGCGAYGFRNTGTAAPASWNTDGNAYYSNTSGARNGVDSTSGVFGTGAYTNALDVTLSASPFTNAAGGDFTLNSTAGGGTACRGTAAPGAISEVSQVGYMDYGCFQAQAAGGIMTRRLWLGGLT